MKVKASLVCDPEDAATSLQRLVADVTISAALCRLLAARMPIDDPSVARCSLGAFT